jgi:putative CocE/NonD family hydrolase
MKTNGQAKKRPLPGFFVGALLLWPLLQASPRQGPAPLDLALKYPEAEGIYEMTVPGQGTIAVQVYFKDGTLRTVESGDAESTIFTAVKGRERQFAKVSPEKGTFLLEFLADERGRLTRFRVVNTKLGLDVTGTKKSAFDDAKADAASRSDRQGYFERHYRKSEHRVPMRDGVRLFTQVYRPSDAAELHPIVVFRTPYGLDPYGEAFTNMTMPSLNFLKENYILVYQDIRGRGMSDGTFEFVRPYREDKTSAADVDESSDAYDTVDWLLKNVPGHNGRVGIWGISYPGFTAAMGAIGAHPAVKAVSPQAPMADIFMGDDAAHNGALNLVYYANYAFSMGQARPAPTTDPPSRLRYPTPDGYAYFLRMGPLKNLTREVFGDANPVWNAAMAHETYDAYWRALSIYPHLRDIKPAILTVGGWYDAEDLGGTLGTYRTIERLNPGLPSTLVMGPWAHARWNHLAGGKEAVGPFDFTGTRSYFQDTVELPFFNYYLKGKGSPNLPEAVVFETGTDRWRSYAAWPPVESKEQALFLRNGGRLASEPPSESPKAGFDEYVSDPAKPVPYTMRVNPQYNRDYFVEDQRFAASRPDVLVYAGEPLAEDLTIAGPIKAELYVSTTGTDADWVVKLIDVYPDDAPDPKDNPANVRMGGYQRLVRGDIFRGKFRNGFEKPEAFVPGRVTKIAFELADVQHAFLKGHRIMVQVQSSWFPLFDRNPQTFCDIRTAGQADFRKATERVYHTARYPSALTVRVLTK